MSIVDQANTLVSLFVKEVNAFFSTRIISIFILGSLNSPENFSLCSDVDVAIMLDNLTEKDSGAINHLQKKIANLNLPFSDKLSIFWSSYNVNDFTSGKGRFPPLDRLLLIKKAAFIFGDDYRDTLPIPTHLEIIIGGVDFISKYMLPEEKLHELMSDTKAIISKGSRYFTKFVLFPVRLIFSLDNPNIIASNFDAVNHLVKIYPNVLSCDALSLVDYAYQCRQLNAKEKPQNIDLEFFQKNLSELYEYCLRRYHDFMLLNNLENQAKKLPRLLSNIIEN